MKRGAILLTIAALILTERFCHEKTEGFRLHKIKSPLTSNARFDSPPIDEHLLPALEQPFHYLGSGGQSYVFASKDGKYVLKFFKQHHMRPRPLLYLLPFTKRWQKTRGDRQLRIYESCKIAQDHFRKETGLLHLHLTRTENLPKSVTLYDPIGVVHKIDLNTLAFALQARATPAYTTILETAASGETEKAKRLLTSLIDLVAKRYTERITDHDPRKRNFGFIDESAVEIDLGSFSFTNEMSHKRTFAYETSKMRRWVKKYAPHLLPHIEKQIAHHLQYNFEISYNPDEAKEGVQ